MSCIDGFDWLTVLLGRNADGRKSSFEVNARAPPSPMQTWKCWKPVCFVSMALTQGGGGGTLNFSAYVGSGPASTLHSNKISGILNTPKYLKF